MHERANANLDDILWRKRRWDGSSAYAESKLHDVMLAFAVARLWPNVLSNAMTPGWVPTKMGGAGAPDDIDQAHLTQAWLATSDERRRADHRRLFLSPEAARAEPRGAGRRVARQAHRHLPGDFRGRPAADLRRTEPACKPSVERSRQRMRAVPEWCVALKLFDISSSYNLSVSSAWLAREFPSHRAPGRLVFDPVLNWPAAPMDGPRILGNRLLRQA